MKVGAPRDFYAGLLFITIGAVGLWVGKSYVFGSVVRMGPGFLPTLLSAATCLVGAAVTIRAIVVQGPPVEFGALRPVVLITLAMVAFGLLIRDYGMVVATLAAIVIGAPATSEFRVKEVLLLAIVMPLFCSVVFVWLLGQPIPIWPSW